MTKYIVKPTTQFKKDLKQAAKSHRNLNLLNRIIKKLANGDKLDAKYRDHSLRGNWKNHRECHIEPDWLLIYKIEDDVLVLTLSRIGSHSEILDR